MRTYISTQKEVAIRKRLYNLEADYLIPWNVLHVIRNKGAIWYFKASLYIRFC